MPVISLSLDQKVIDSLKDEADKQKRSVSQMAEILLEKALE